MIRTSCLASKSSQILEALQIEESNKILKNKDFATIDVQIYSLRGFEMMLLSPTHFVVITQELRPVESGGVTVPPPPLPHTHTQRPQRSTFLLTSDLKQSQLRVFSVSFYSNSLIVK